MLITAGPSVMGPHCLREVSTLPTMSEETRLDATGVINLLILFLALLGAQEVLICVHSSSPNFARALNLQATLPAHSYLTCSLCSLSLTEL